MDTNQDHSTNHAGRKLYELTVKDAATANLLTIVNDPDFIWDDQADSDDASGALRLGFWVLLAAPLVSLFLIGLFFGSGN